MTFTLAFIAIAAVTFWLMFFRAIVVAELVNWFVAPWLGLDPISWGHGFGLVVLVASLLMLTATEDAKDPSMTAAARFAESCMKSIFTSSIALGIGWVAQHWI